MEGAGRAGHGQHLLCRRLGVVDGDPFGDCRRYRGEIGHHVAIAKRVLACPAGEQHVSVVLRMEMDDGQLTDWLLNTPPVKNVEQET